MKGKDMEMEEERIKGYNNKRKGIVVNCEDLFHF